MPYGQFARIVGDLLHDTSHESGFAFSIPAHESYLVASVDGEVHMVEHQMLPESLTNLITDYGKATTTVRANEFQSQGGIVFFIHFNRHHFLQHLDAALYLNSLSGFISEPFNEILRILNHLLLVLKGTKLLLTSFFAQVHKLIILNLIIINMPARDFNGTSSHIIEESTVMTH